MTTRRLFPAILVLALTWSARAADDAKPAAPPAKTPPPAQQKDAPKEAKDKKPAAPTPTPLVSPAPKDLDDAMRRLARTRVNVSFKDVKFQEAVDYVRRVAGFNVIVSPAQQAKGVDGLAPITMTLTDVSLKQLAELVAQMTGTKFKFADSILQFTTPEDARGKPVLHLHASGAEFEPEPESDVENAWSDPQKVVEMIQRLCSPESWTDKDVSISADENKLIVKQYPEVHREIARLIGLLRASR
jgi:type II secretory pathway component GspD/PulD (secretin)